MKPGITRRTGAARSRGRGVRKNSVAVETRKVEPTLDPAAAIVESAARCFQRWGIARTRIEDIAEDVGIARPHIYRYFESKDAIIHAVILREIRHHHARLTKRFPLDGPAEPLILGCLLSGVFDAAKDSDTAFLVRSDGAPVTAKMLVSSEEIVAETRRHWVPLLEYARARGELRDGVDIAAATQWLTFLEFSYLALPELAPRRAHVAEQFRSFVLPALLRPVAMPEIGDRNDLSRPAR